MTGTIPNPWIAAAMIGCTVVLSTAGEVLTAAAMKSIGDLDDIRAHSGMKGAIRAVVTCPLFFAGVGFLALAFFSLLFALNHLNLSLVAPAAASLTLVTNAIAGKVLPQRKCGSAAMDGGGAGLHWGVSAGALNWCATANRCGVRRVVETI